MAGIQFRMMTNLRTDILPVDGVMQRGFTPEAGSSSVRANKGSSPVSRRFLMIWPGYEHDKTRRDAGVRNDLALPVLFYRNDEQ